jgi:predicted nucleic acid-binding protein
MVLILDTSALVSLERTPELWQTSPIPADGTVLLPAVVWAEALIGVRMADSAQRAARRLTRLQAIRRLTGLQDFTEAIAEHYADIFFELHQKGTLIPQNDIQVAATARAHDGAVLVGVKDEAHFRRIENLEVITL